MLPSTFVARRCQMLFLFVILAVYDVRGWKFGPIGYGSTKSRMVWNRHDGYALLRIPARGGGRDEQSKEHDVPNKDEPQETPNDAAKTVDSPLPENQDSEETHTETDSYDSRMQAVPVMLPTERKRRHASDVLVHLMDHDSELNQESIELRELISNRAQSYIEMLSRAEDKIPHPKRVLHYVAPKIPAIKHSPDVMLRIQSYKGGTDTGVAACAIGTVARLCELYDRRKLQDGDSDEEAFESVGTSIVKDRRFQQLVECVLCGVDLKRSEQEAEASTEDDEREDSVKSRDIQEVLEEEGAVIDDGLSVQDACRAAWGVAVLAGFHTETFSDVSTADILKALSSRCKQLLLARLQLLREGETQRKDNDGTLTLSQRLDQDAEDLAKDSACAMWTFACAKACTGVRSVSLFETCCSILCQDLIDLRERAKIEKEGLDGSAFEVNDVIDKLERSEIDTYSNDNKDRVNGTTSTASTNMTTNEQESSVARDGLLDWLTPNEVTDVLWALALHGSTVDTDSKEEIALSETAAAFREIAFDRLVGWLRCDLDIIEAKDGDTNSSTVSAVEFENDSEPRQQEEVVVEVVDAAKLLASSPTMETEVVKASNVNVHDSLEAVDAHQVQVVDAATLLACSPEIPMEKETEMLVASTLARSYESLSEPLETADVEANEEPSDVLVTTTENSERTNKLFQMDVLMRSGELLFSPHDLCSIAWAVTDLRDPLRYLIVDLITQMFSCFGRDSLFDLPMADLSNLAWAIARSASQKQALSFEEYSKTPAAAVNGWIAEGALARLEIDGRVLEDHAVLSAIRSVLQEFQPPELGRLMWSLACTVSNHMDPFDKKERDVAVSQLAELALVAAGTNLSIFSTEDLTRIAWAFLELCDTSTALTQPLVAESLGSILAVIESSLLEWERGPASKSRLVDSKHGEDSLHFSTFFGKSRFPLLLLNQRIHEHEDEEDGHQATKKKSLPLLRDLPVDPSSLCKLSSAYTRLCREQQNLGGGWTFVRVAVRLLSSKNGQLMEQCPLVDVIGLCHACAISQVNSRERGQVVRLFAGRVIEFVNQVLDPDDDANGKASARLARATPWEVATLLWSVSELGARHCTADENRRLAHRKLRLVSDRSFLSEDGLQSLSASSTLNLLHGITLMDVGTNDPSFVIKVLQAMGTKLDSLQTGHELVDFARTAAKLRRAAKSLEQHLSDEMPTNSNTANGSNSKDDKSEDSSPNKKEINTQSAADEPQLEHHNSTKMAVHGILDSSTQVLTKVSEVAIEMVKDLSAEEMSDLLLIYSTIPLQVDDLVNAIDDETRRRLKVLGFKGPTESVQDLARRAFDCSILTSNTLSSEAESSSAIDTIKNGIKSIFGVNEDRAEVSEEDMAALAALAETAQRTTTLIQETLGRMEQIRQGTGRDTESLLRGVEQGAAIELGRCQELVAAYRRIDFSTGIRTRRYDIARRRDISKRILSRLFP